MIDKYEMQKPKSKLFLYLIYALLFSLVFIWAFVGINYKGVMATARGTFRGMLNGILNPDLVYIKNTTIDGLGYALIETITIAISGTFISAMISLPFAFLASQNIVGKKISRLGKFFITCIRVFPELILAIIFIKVLGPGPMAGVMALGIHSIGMLGKLYSEAIESMDMGSVEALEACGATGLQKLFHGVIPEILPALMGFSLYRFEINTRAASTLGIVGAGGIGAPLLFAITGRNWSRTFTLVFSLIIMVILVDFFSGKIRKRIQ
ncbi:MAG TPA: phosphonate ABC transporter, permease protein PhnE [Clostridia bacterium]|nr:phosphonate ABC transporter, permease protein PhnE [Clostridia bacterium]